ncbi:BNR repeat-containing protein [Sphingomonas sp. MA1305]|uniref:BNR repeat-containing protein n=1 Tax=Sphingomonas sp. MA1305 TaxID=2479204 RepID=UPI0018DF4503|nr:BNR repeat-containing protein [Sphingomonas sp. MA1305]
MRKGMGLAAALLLAGAAPAQQAAVPAPASAPTVQLSAIDRVWAGHSARFALAVTEAKIFVAYYDANRQLTVASRDRHGSYWIYHKLDCWVGWDSHNYIAMAVDAAGQLHVAANMHRDPLVYYRTRIAGDVRSFVHEPVMVDARLERSMTYPIFLHDAAGRLVYKYRDGGSGNGNEIYNVYDPATRQWSHLLSTPLTDGQGQRNAYFVGPVLGPDGYFHIAWVWRETPMAETNHDLSYAKSRDLVHWQKADGTPLTLPITLKSGEIVDPVPVEGGMINNNTLVGFDPAGRAMITYHKFDKAGNTQIYVARREGARWHIVQVSDWQGFRWDFRGGGSLDSRLFVSGAVPVGKDRVRVSVIRDGKPIDFLLDAATLRRISETPGRSLAQALAGGSIAVPAGMMLNTVEDNGVSGVALAWPTLPPHRDVASADIPEPTVLRLVEGAGR